MSVPCPDKANKGAHYAIHPALSWHIDSSSSVAFISRRVTYIWVVLRKGVPWGGDRVRDCITHLLSIKSLNVDDFHVSVAINI